MVKKENPIYKYDKKDSIDTFQSFNLKKSKASIKSSMSIGISINNRLLIYSRDKKYREKTYDF